MHDGETPTPEPKAPANLVLILPKYPTEAQLQEAVDLLNRQRRMPAAPGGACY